MAKTVIPIKIIVNLNNDGTLRDGLFQYRLNADGIISNKANTIGIQDAMDEQTITDTNTLIQKVLDLANESEGIE